MPTFKGITCSVNINGSRAQEYGYDVNGSTVTCNIISEDDMPFTFTMNFVDSKAQRHDYSIYTDGILVAHMTTTRRIQDLTETHRNLNGRWENRSMKFAKLETVDQKVEGLESRADILKDVGVLKVLIWRAEYAATVLDEPTPSKATPEIEKVHEKSLKGRAVPHKTSLGAAKYRHENTISTVRLDPNDYPYIIFKFRYTSKACLQSEGLIPRSPSPDITVKDDDDEDSVQEMSPEALRREVLRLRNKNRRGRGVKRELESPSTLRRKRNQDDDDDDDDVIIESVRDVKRSRIENVPVIDLVDDSD